MKKILNIVGHNFFQIILIIAILVCQAMLDLKIPEYTADIVDVGISNKGIASATPKFILKEDLSTIKLFLNPEEMQKVDDSYQLLTEENLGAKKYQKYLKKYDINENQEIYLLNSAEDLDAIFNKSNLLYSLLTNKDYQYTLSPEVDTLTLLKNMDTANRLETVEKLNKELEANINDLVKDNLTLSTVQTYYQNAGINIDRIQLDYILKEGLIMLGLACLVMAFVIASTYLIARLAANIAREMRSAVVNKIMSFANQEFEQFQTSSLITRSTNDVQQVQMFIVMALRIVIYAPIMGLGSLAKVRTNQMSWILGISLLCVLSLIIILFTVALPKFKSIQNKIDKLNLISREILSGIPVIRAFSTEKYEEKRFDKANKDLTKINLFVNRTMSIMFPLMTLIMNGTGILIVWIGSKNVDLGTIQVGDIMALMTYSMHVIMSFLMFSMISIMMPRALVSFKRVGEVLNVSSSIQDPVSPKNFVKNQRGVVEFKDVYFRYPDAAENVISNINFTALPGTTTAFIGSTGSGKSTLINLIPRFFDVTSGKILIDGVNIKDVKLKSLRHKIGYVPQRGLLFKGTIASNIGFGLNKPDMGVVTQAAKVAQATEFIEDKPEKYASEISQGGTNVSGGQRQRLAIARAIATSPDIYIFDDSFSALDFKTDARLRKELSKITKDKTIFIVAQRISTIMHADQIIVLDQGTIVGKGTHEELLQNCDVYKEIALSQLSEEELTNA